ncbi:unnamed protein product [Leptidea sinapis]|uniref:UDP-glucuronosyltransferase n=1 Tax=Leptidea sinapis TaxID=189913 RepID=A0A5E4QF26_9NEOP|nr:unnamed protein product [Leptidea sinapis]
MNWLLYLVACLAACGCQAYKILVVYPMPSRSHSILGDGIVDALAETSHEITYITPFPRGKTNFREIDLSSNLAIFPEKLINIEAQLNKTGGSLHNFTFFIDWLSQASAKTVEHPSVQALMADPNEQFDLVIVEWVYYELLAGFSAVFNCPYIWVSSADPHWKIVSLVDDILNPAYNSDAISNNFPPFTFVQRLQELGFLLGGLYVQEFFIDRIQYSDFDRLFAPAIARRGHQVPSFTDLKYNASLVLSNSHLSIGKSVKLPPNFIPIAGYHIKRKVEPLPENLQKFMSNAKEGVIYFSMGTNLKSKYMPAQLKQDLLKMFSQLKYSVIWKFEEEIPNTPSNVLITQWAPQQSILAHPNCKLFITHGGLLSTTEAVHFGKPIIVIPVFADQFSNADRAVQKGYAIRIELSYNLADDIRATIAAILNDPKYALKSKELSFIYHDRPVSPDKEMVHWVEHVIKTKGARHLRSPAFGVPMYQKLYLDLLAIIAIVLYIIIYLIKRIIAYIFCSKTETNKVAKKKKKQ